MFNNYFLVNFEKLANIVQCLAGKLNELKTREITSQIPSFVFLRVGLAILGGWVC